ncbi:MFS transporter [Okibacterium endophyticum]
MSKNSSSLPAVRPHRQLVAWRNALFVIFALSGLSISTWVARLPAIRDSLELSTSAVGVLIFCMAAGSIIGLMVSAPLLARLGARRGMIITLGLVAIGLLLIGVGSALVPSPVIVGLGLALFGFGNGSVDVIMNVEAAAAEGELRKTVMPLMHAFFSFGTMTGAGLGALASAVGVSVFWHSLAIAVLVAIAVVIAVRYVPIREGLGDTSTIHERPDWKQRLIDNLKVWADIRLILIGVVMLGMAFAEGSANDWLALAAVDGHGLSNAMGAVVFGVFTAAMTVGRLIGGPIIDRLGRVVVLQASAVSAVVGLLMFILAPWDWMMFAGTVLWGLGASLGFPVGMSAAADDSHNPAARVSAVAMIGYCAFLVGPPMIGLIGDQIGLLNALFVVLGLVALSGLASPATRSRSGRAG